MLLKFGGLVAHYGLKPRTTGRTGCFKWQCSANCHLFYFLIFACRSPPLTTSNVLNGSPNSNGFVAHLHIRCHYFASFI